jgi:hypothetical protein
MRIDSAGNLGVGATPSAWQVNNKAIQIFGGYASLSANNSQGTCDLAYNAYNTTSAAYNGWKYANSSAKASLYQQLEGTHSWFTAPTGTAGNTITFTQAMTLTNTGLDINATFGGGTFPFRVGYTTAGTYYPNMVLNDSGNLLVGLTATGAYLDGRINAQASGGSPAICAKLDPSGATTQFVYSAWAPYTTGNQVFHSFETETTAVIRGTISYNRAGGLTVYNTTSDYRAKTVNGVVENALEKVALLKPCTGRMNGASEDIDFFVAHELQEVIPSAVTGEKDATKEEAYEISPAIPAVLDEEGNEVTPAVEAVMGTRTVPEYQMVDKSAIIPLLTAAIQELKAIVDTQAEQIKALQGVK